MSLEVLEKIAGELGNEELTGALAAVKASFSSNIDRINSLEKDVKSSAEKRDAIKTMVRGKLGLDELSEESLDKFLSSNKKKGNDEFVAEKKQLEDMIAMLQEEKSGLSNKLQNTINMNKVEKTLNSLGAGSETNGEKAYELLLTEASRGVSFNEDGSIVFKANDGTTIRNTDGSPMSIQDRYNQLKDSDEFGFLFKEPASKSGSGYKGGARGGEGQVTSLEGLNDAQRVALFRNNPELFRKLAQQN